MLVDPVKLEVEKVIQTPRHPYTTGLISCVPHLDDTITDANTRLSEIPGIVPSIREFGSNKCLFASRCKYQMDQCWAERPGLTQISNKQAMHAGKERQLMQADEQDRPLLKVHNLRVEFATKSSIFSRQKAQ